MFIEAIQALIGINQPEPHFRTVGLIAICVAGHREAIQVDGVSPFRQHILVPPVRGPGTFSSFVAVRRTMSYSCRRAASGSIRDARLACA